MKSKTIPALFFTMLKIGLFTFGGGYAMIALLENEFVTKRGWLEQEEFLDVAAIAESTPGPIAINSATFVGWRVAGFFGAALATFGVVLPSFVVILLISFLLTEFAALDVVQYAFQGIRAGVLALLIKALWTMYKKNPKSLVGYGIMAASFIVVAFLKVPVLAVIAGCALVGLGSSLWLARKEGGKK